MQLIFAARYAAACAVLSPLFLGACSKLGAVIHPYALEAVPDTATQLSLTRHSIFVDDEGKAIAPVVGKRGRTLTDAEYTAYLDTIVDRIRLHADSGYPDVLIRIHGGLNALRSSPGIASRMEADIRNDSAKHIYPLFINWDSGILESYGEHLFYVRQGQRRPLDLVGAPFFFVADLGRAATRLPIVWFGQVRRNFGCMATRRVPPRPDTTPKKPLSPRDSALKAYLALNDCAITGAFEDNLYRYDDSLKILWKPRPDSLRIPIVSRFAYRQSPGWFAFNSTTSLVLSVVPTRTFWSWRPHGGSAWKAPMGAGAPHSVGRVGRSIVNIFSWLPPKVLSLMLLDAIGTPAWQNMRRRTKTMFVQPYAANDYGPRAPVAPKPAAVEILFDRLERMQRAERANPHAHPTRLTLVGHSMGAIIASEALRRHGSLNVANVVYMAPALSLREFQIGTLPYLEHHDSTQFFNLTLHPLSDSREAPFHGLAPYGSLLSWLDAYLDNPDSELDRMMGKYQNTTEAADIFVGPVRARIHLKAFGYGDKTGCGRNGFPFEHGHFNEPGVPFWDPKFWIPGIPCPDATRLPRLRDTSTASVER